jgi:hypothetical protein
VRSNQRKDGEQASGQETLDYFCLEDGQEVRLFKKVDFPGRARAVIFVLQAGKWAPALGLWPAVQGTPEWDPQARWITANEARRLLEQMGLPPDQIDRLTTGREGRRRNPRPV